MTEPVRYPVRTSSTYWATTALMTGLCGVVIGGMALPGKTHPTMLIVLAGLIIAAIGTWLGTKPYRIGAGRNLISIYPDRIEVPALSSRAPMVFPRDGLMIRVINVSTQYRLVLTTLATLRRGKLIELRRGETSRTLSTLVLEHPRDEAALLADLQRFMTGVAPIGAAEFHAQAAVRTAYDDRIDRELAQLDS